MKATNTNHADQRFSTEIRNGQSLLELARDWLKQGNPVVAIELLKSAGCSSEAENNPELRAKVLKETGRAMMMQSAWDGAENHYVEAQRLFLLHENWVGAAECARNRANMYFQKGMYGKAETLCQQALDWIAALNDHQLRATVLNTLGAVKSATGDLRESIKVFRLCLADFQAAGNVIRQGYVLLNIGLTQTELGEYVEAIQNLQEALAVAFSEKDLQLVEICYQNIARCHLAEGETIMARSVLDTARKILPGLNSRALEVELDLLDCKVLRAMGNTVGAEERLNATYDAAVKNRLTSLQADVLLEQGYLHRDTGEHSLAACKLEAAASLYKQLGMDKGFQDAVQVLENLRRRSA